ncbi:Response regulator receiver domain-containing protein [Chryseolinea serpens]|uniref:Response regulator receiver domain-containing protein n=1 Tax=Chryseolinea serpens TaxID=947013 RepID=A0A1M5M7I0_9BACT|nr:response regulator [Chryseolinea serpens]SHG73222.1 Response regulator receiver domain-containing protein [Chryseolinea serpens]
MLIINVDDDADDREMFCEALRAIDELISCVQHDSGQKALEFLRSHPETPDFIFVDINMPKMNGYECVYAIRSIDHLQHVPIVMFSTAFNPHLQHPEEKNVTFVAKSSRFNELVESIKALILVPSPPAERS